MNNSIDILCKSLKEELDTIKKKDEMKLKKAENLLIKTNKIIKKDIEIFKNHRNFLIKTFPKVNFTKELLNNFDQGKLIIENS